VGECDFVTQVASPTTALIGSPRLSGLWSFLSFLRRVGP
jgi:hypothetical protein